MNPYTDFGFKKRFGEEDLLGVVDTSYEEGKTEGRVEGNIEIALKMKKMGEPAEKISKYTGLSIEEINKLKPGE